MLFIYTFKWLEYNTYSRFSFKIYNSFQATDRGHSDVIQSILSQCKELKNIQDNRGRFPMDCYQGKDESIKDLLKT